MIWELRHEYKIGLLIEISGIPRSTYYYHAGRFEKPDKYAEIKEKILYIYDESKGRYGYRRITAELRKTHKINHKTVQKLMRKMGIYCHVRMKKYRSYKGEVGKITPNLLGIVSERGIMSSAYIRLRPIAKSNLRYFYYQYYDWYKRNIFNGLGGGVRQTLSASDLMELSILYPPKYEQDKIVSFLDWEARKVNLFISAKKKEIKLLQELKKTLICKYITGQKSGCLDFCETKASYVDEVSKGWEDYRLQWEYSQYADVVLLRPYGV